MMRVRFFVSSRSPRQPWWGVTAGAANARKEAKKLLTETPKSLSRKKFGEAYDLWKVAIETKKPRTQKDYKRHIEKRFLPSLGSKKLEDVIFEQVTKATAKLPKALRGEGVSLEEIKERLGM